jgi:hypothetical protein
MKKHERYDKLEGFKSEHKITNDMIAKALNISVTSVVNKNIGISDYYVSEVKTLKQKLKIPYSVFLS